ncbi:TetR/AcrR family transcriptional regulator [Nocardia abscessus]|nr:TetR family transcriptional regulator [Nocardia abscessus]
MTRDAILAAAIDLTRVDGLEGWSLRDLAARLDTSLSVIYHHIGDRERVVAAVVEHVWTMLELPLDEPDWRCWLHGVLAPLDSHLRQFPGVAAWFMRNGPQLSVLMPVVEAGVSRLLDAGFGNEAPLAYTVAFSTCIGLIVTGDRTVRTETGPNIDSLSEMLDTTPVGRHGTAHMQRMVEQYTDEARRDQARSALYAYALERTLDGLEARLRQLTSADR